jgi:hypothetical protein
LVIKIYVQVVPPTLEDSEGAKDWIWIKYYATTGAILAAMGITHHVFSFLLVFCFSALGPQAVIGQAGLSGQNRAR